MAQYNKICPKCGERGHSKFYCRNTPRKSISRIGKVTRKWIEYRKQWMIDHKDEDWICYLQISPLCLIKLRPDTLTLDHVKPRSGNPELRFKDSNIKPACEFCNAMKGSRRL